MIQNLALAGLLATFAVATTAPPASLEPRLITNFDTSAAGAGARA